LAWKLAIPAASLALVGPLAVAGQASASHTAVTTSHSQVTVKKIKPAKFNMLDCNGYSSKYKSANQGMRRLCTDPHSYYDGHQTRFLDNNKYVGHDEPSVKFISSQAGSGNTMNYGMQLPVDPSKAPTASGSVTKYGELSVAPWFGLPLCDPQSYPQNACTQDSDTNTGLNKSASDAGSAFMELQFYPPGFAPFTDSLSCSETQWCAAITIDSLECTFNFATCNNNCIEPVNFAYLQTDGIPAGSPAPQDPSLSTFTGNAQTLKMSPGDVLKVSITDPIGGLTTTVQDLTTKQTGTMQASATNHFADTFGIQSPGDCSGQTFTWHAEYSSAKKQNQVPWAALEGGVLMQQEIGHFESCGSVTHKEGFSATYSSGTYSDPRVFQTCSGGSEGSGKTGEGPCSATTGVCQHAMTQGTKGPKACPSNNAGSGRLCGRSDAFCFPKGHRTVMLSGVPTTDN